MLCNKHPQNFSGSHTPLFLGICSCLGFGWSRPGFTETVLLLTVGLGSTGSQLTQAGLCSICVSSFLDQDIGQAISPHGNVRSTRGRVKAHDASEAAAQDGQIATSSHMPWPKQAMWPSNTKSREVHSFHVKGMDARRRTELGSNSICTASSKGQHPMQF